MNDMIRAKDLAALPAEYAGNARSVEPRLTPTGRVATKPTADLARDLRREGLREAHGQESSPRRKRRWER